MQKENVLLVRLAKAHFGPTTLVILSVFAHIQYLSGVYDSTSIDKKYTISQQFY